MNLTRHTYDGRCKRLVHDAINVLVFVVLDVLPAWEPLPRETPTNLNSCGEGRTQIQPQTNLDNRTPYPQPPQLALL